MAGKRWLEGKARFVIAEDSAAVSAIVSGEYPTGSLMFRIDNGLFYQWNGTSWNLQVFNGNTLTSPIMTNPSISGTVTIPQTGGVATTPLVFSKSDTPTSGFDHIVKFMIDTDANSFLTVQNQSSTASTFLPTLRFTQGSTSVAALIIGAGTTDSGTSPLITFDARTVADGAISTRPLVRFATAGNVKVNFNATNVTLSDAYDIVVNATTGTKIGTATTQKIGFHNATPTAQAAFIASPDTTGAQLKTAVDAIRTLLIDKGLMAAS